MTEAETLLGKPLIETLPTDPDPGEIGKIRVGTDNGGVFTGKSFAVFIASRPELETSSHETRISWPKRVSGNACLGH